MKNIKQSFLAILLVLCFLVLNVSTIVASAVESDTVYDKSESAYEMLEATGSIDKEQFSPLVLESLDSAECMISKYVSADQFNEASHVERLYAEEELDTYVFLNSDGTKSVYYMDENVKFFDKNGDVKEKDISLVSKSDGYGIVRNEFDLHIPNSATSGISMSYNGYEVKISPQSTARTAPARKVGETVVYDGFFGTNTSLVYTPMLSGIKEDVIMKAYIPSAEFSFVLDTDGLGLYNNDEGYYLAESESSEVILELGKVIIYDAIGKPDYGTMNVTTVTANQKYILSLSAPEEFLTDPTTVYPVTIDPTLTVSDTATGDGAIEDTVLFSNRPSKNYGDYKYLSIGYVDSTYGAGRVAVKLPGLYNSIEYQNVTASEITSVKFYCRDSSGNSAQNINLYRITSAAWDENTVTYGDSVTYSTATNWGTSLPNAVSTAFDITTLVKGWKNGTYTASKGFILINPNETSASYKKAPFSSEYTTTSYRPYVVFTYEYEDTDGISVDVSADTTYLLVGGTRQVSCSTEPSGLSVAWSSNNSSIATVNSSGVVTGVSEGTVKITATYTDSATGTKWTDYVYLYVKDSLGIKDDTEYYVMNYSSRRYLSIAEASDTNYTNVCTQERSTLNLSQWKADKQTDGTFQLVSVYSSTGKVLDKTGTNIDIYSDNNANYQKFSIYRINSGTYQGLYYIRHGNYYVAQDSNYNVYLTTTASSNAVWSFMAVNQRYAELFCHDYMYEDENGTTRHFDTSTNYNYFKTVMTGLGYLSFAYENPSSESAYTYLKRDDDVFVFMGHGGSGRIAFYTEGNVATGRILAHSNMGFANRSPFYISNLNKNELCLNRCVIYLGCSTGTDYTIGSNTYNLVDATYEKGAHFVLGTTETLYTSQINDWLEYFLDGILEGMNISQAKAHADDTLGEITVPYTMSDGNEGYKNVKGLPTYSCGDKTQYLNID